MPYKIKQVDGGYAVVNKDTGKRVPGGKHKTRRDAIRHMRALYANVADSRSK